MFTVRRFCIQAVFHVKHSRGDDMTKWVLNKRTKTAHATEGGRTFCQWWAGDMLPIDNPLEASRVCTDCAAKLRKANARVPWSTPLVFRHDKYSFFARINKRVRYETVQSMALEAAQKGYWGRIS